MNSNVHDGRFWGWRLVRATPDDAERVDSGCWPWSIYPLNVRYRLEFVITARWRGDERFVALIHGYTNEHVGVQCHYHQRKRTTYARSV